MTIFEKATLDADRTILKSTVSDYGNTWNSALSKYTKSEKTLKKVCPRNAFIDLCSFGYVKGISRNKMAELSENVKMAIEALRILQRHNWQFEGKKQFWWEHFHKTHEGQLDVILALKNANLLSVENC